MHSLLMTLNQIRNDNRVADFSNETGNDDGYFVSLHAGFADMGYDPHRPTHEINEYQVKDLSRRMKDVRPCTCKECTDTIEFEAKPQAEKNAYYKAMREQGQKYMQAVKESIQC